MVNERRRSERVIMRGKGRKVGGRVVEKEKGKKERERQSRGGM